MRRTKSASEQRGARGPMAADSTKESMREDKGSGFGVRGSGGAAEVGAHQQAASATVIAASRAVRTMLRSWGLSERRASPCDAAADKPGGVGIVSAGEAGD